MLKSKRIILIVSFVILSLIVLTAFRLAGKGNAGITKYDWIEALCKQFNIAEHQTVSPYFSDVAPDNEHFKAVQSAYEWDVLEEASAFNGDKKITGEYAALTAMKAIGAYKVKIYLDLSELPTDNQLLELAIGEGIINKSEFSKKVSENRAAEILTSAYDLYYAKMWVDDYYNYTYSEGVIEVEKGDVVSYDADKDEIVLNDKARSSITSGSIIVFYDNDGFKVSKTVDHIGADGKATLSQASVEDTIDELVMSDMFLSDDVFDAFFEQSYNGFSSTKNAYTVIPVNSIGASSKGVSVSVKISGTEAEITIKSNDTGKKKTAKYKGNFFTKSSLPDITEEYVEFTTEVTKINVGIQGDYSILGGMKFNYFLAQIETEMETRFEAGGNVEAVIPLSTITLAGNDLIAAVNLELKLVMTMDGKVSITAEFPSEALFEYRKDSGVRHYANATANVEAEICCSLEESLRFEPVIVLLKNKILDLELDIGAGAKSSIKTRNNSNVTTCLDISSYAPLLGLGFLNDEDSLLGDYLDGKNMEIISSDNAQYKEDFHFEWYKNGTSKRVEECTFSEDGFSFDISPPRLFYAKFSSDFERVKDHYEATGTVVTEVFVKDSELSGLSVGDTFVFETASFTVTDIGEYHYGGDKYYIFDKKYMVGTGSYSTPSSVDFTVYPIMTLAEGSLNPIQQGDKVFLSPNGDKKVFVTVATDCKLSTLDYDDDPYFLPVKKNEWYSIDIMYGNSDAVNDEAGRIGGAALASDFEERAIVIQ